MPPPADQHGLLKSPLAHQEVPLVTGILKTGQAGPLNSAPVFLLLPAAGAAQEHGAALVTGTVTAVVPVVVVVASAAQVVALVLGEQKLAASTATLGLLGLLAGVLSLRGLVLGLAAAAQLPNLSLPPSPPLSLPAARLKF